MRRRNAAALPPLALALLLLAACGQGKAPGNAAGPEPESNLSASGSQPREDLAALVGASPRLRGLVEAAGMGPVLSGKAPYTLLAPSDAALDALPPGTLERLAQPEQKAALTALLRAHILPGTILAADLVRAVEAGKGRATIATMAGEPLTVTREGDELRLAGPGGASVRVIGTEQPARNGVVHQIDGLLSPGT